MIRLQFPLSLLSHAEALPLPSHIYPKMHMVPQAWFGAVNEAGLARAGRMDQKAQASQRLDRGMDWHARSPALTPEVIQPS